MFVEIFPIQKFEISFIYGQVHAIGSPASLIQVLLVFIRASIMFLRERGRDKSWIYGEIKAGLTPVGELGMLGQVSEL